MPVEIRVPPLSQTMDSLVLVAWLKQPGDPVQKGEPLFTVETDKATLDVESPGSGVLGEVTAEPGDEMKVGSVIGVIALPAGTGISGGAPTIGPATDRSFTSLETVTSTIGPATGRVFVSPRARRLARQQGLRVDDLPYPGSGPGGEFITRDVETYLLRQTASAPVGAAMPVASTATPPRVTPLARRMAEAAGLNLDNIHPGKAGLVTKADVMAGLDQTTALPSPVAGFDQTTAHPVPVVGQRGIAGSASSESGLQADQITPASPTSFKPAPPAPGQASVAGSTPPLAEPGFSRQVSLTPTRRTIAQRLQASHLASVPVTYMREVDATRLVKLRGRILSQLTEGVERPTITDFLVLLTCKALAKHPELNAVFDGETLQVFNDVHLALAVDTPRGLVAPVLRRAQSYGLAELARQRKDLVERALNGILAPAELNGGTFTLTNLGPLGIDIFTPVINPPQVAILGVGRIREVPAVHKGKVRPRSMLGLALTCDHRVIDGAPAARFMEELAGIMVIPELGWL